MSNDALTPLTIRRAKPGYNPKAKASEQPEPLFPFKLRDGKGLYLEVRPSGKKIWRYRYRIAGVENLFTIGEYGDRADQFTVAAAREERDQARKLVKQGLHPGHQRKAAVAATVEEHKNTFRSVAQDWLEENQPEWSAVYSDNVTRALDNCILPDIGDRPIRAVKAADLAAILKKHKKHATTAQLMRQWMGAIFRYAIAHQRADGDPTFALRGAIKKPAVKHHAPMALKDIPAFVASIDGYTGTKPTKIALRLLLLTFVRPGELCAAEWPEFDLDDGLWRIPAERMKMGEPHLVPLSHQAVVLLRELHALTGNRTFLFPSMTRPKSGMRRGSLSAALLIMGYRGKFTPHGCRATASTALNEMGFRPDVIEKQLAHAERNQSRASYNQGQYLDERRAMMQQWAKVIDATIKAAKDENSSKIIPIKGKKAKHVA